ncbi:hypothetical protein NDU88_001033 [Pleurodeles waltl]|uniref:Uncharacterized protein n=1 Tax=Pleurodeles waltl TaxID=8319 RepID=A0AAV7MJW0_PLEWA|nr:hypothetical protein NDU88_001033 [Pleurodeles waltl]
MRQGRQRFSWLHSGTSPRETRTEHQPDTGLEGDPSQDPSASPSICSRLVLSETSPHVPLSGRATRGLYIELPIQIL